MSSRSAIYDALVTALSSSTEFAYVARKRENWWDWSHNKFPGLCVLDSDEKKRRFAYPGASTSYGDMYSEIDFTIDGYERDITNTLDAKRSSLIQQIETVITKSTGVRDLVLDIFPVTVKTDDGMLENFTVTESVFRVKYLYNHSAP